MHRHLTYICAAVMALAVTACGKYEKPKSSSTIGTFEMMCDDSFENIMEQEVDVFEYQYPDAHALVRYAPATEVIDSMLNGDIRTICIPRELTQAERDRVKKRTRQTVRQQRIAVDAVALIVNPANPVQYVSPKEVAAILSGQAKTWQDLDPSYPDKPVHILFDKVGSSMIGYMRDSLLAETGDTLASLYGQGSVRKVIETVKEDKNVIGVVGVSWLTSDLRDSTPMDSLAKDLNDETTAADMGQIDEQVKGSGVKVLGVRTGTHIYKPYQQNIYNGTYPFTRSIFMATTNVGGPASGFYSFVTGYVGQKLLMKTGVMPARMHIQVVELVE
ncbi:MAG: substrate-binding domain-containing protein [Clostridium sp.]|nr:substrate-binding domain-containing protein [Clostridium sp.]